MTKPFESPLSSPERPSVEPPKRKTCRVVSWRHSRNNARRYWVVMACGYEMWMETARDGGPKWSSTCPCVEGW